MPAFAKLRPSAIGIRAKVGILVGCLVVLSSSMVGFLTYRQSSAALVENAMDEVRGVARSAAGLLEAGLESTRRDVEFLAASPASKELAQLGRVGSSPAQLEAAQADFVSLAWLVLRAHPEYLGVGLFDPAGGGRWIEDLDRPALGLGAAGRPGPGPVDDPFLFETAAVAAPAGRYSAVTPFEVGQDRGALLRVAAPVHDAEGRVLALLVIREDLGPLLEEVAAGIPPRRDLVIVEPSGRFVSHPDPGATLQLAGPSAPLASDLHPGLARTMLQDGPQPGTLVHRGPDGRRTAASVQRLGLGGAAALGGFGVGVVADYQDVVAGARAVRDQTLAFTLVLVAFAVLLGWRLAASIAGPLDRIAGSVEAYGRGSAELDLPLEAPGEAGVVARAFDHMARQVDERARLLQAEVDARRLTEQALRSSENRFRAFYHDSPAMFLSTDTDGTIVSVNRFGADHLGYRAEDLVGRNSLILVPTDDREEAGEFLRAVVHADGRLHEREGRMLRRDGTPIWVRTIVRVLNNEDGRTVLWVGEDTTRARELTEDLSFREHHDVLTGLPNRREVERRLQILVEHASEKGSEHALCLLDLDQFKVVNDTCGHAAGDELLRQISRVLEAHVDPPDLLARLGGDEFALLLKDCPLHHAISRVEGLRTSLKTMHFSWEGQRFEITASVGMVQIRGTDHSVSTAMSLADTLCFAAKDAGRDRLQVYQEGDTSLEQIQEQMKAVSMITRAFEEDLFRLYRQPIVPVGCGEEGDHFEILIRMVGEEGQILPPGVFLQSAERYNLAGRIDRWVVASTLNWLKRNPEELARLALCSINLSGQSLGDTELLEFVESQFDDGLIPPDRICFEITETAAVANMKAAIEFIQRLKRRGCLFALDDFGSGLSSFAYLRNLPVDLLKIDGMFVRDIATDPTAFAMVKSIHEVGRVMGKRTIAEFVENDRILEKLAHIGVDYAQGYGISPPRPIEEPLFDRLVLDPDAARSGGRDAA
ncbi:MAG: EAL domain-containing protein [Planctomycetes bacterium]|nr:EAL domain-containing protein [Planctomycetota bacterium]